MAQLGSMLPPGMRRALLERRLVPGAIILLNITFRDGTTKPKFILLVASDGDDHYFIINSEPTAFIRRRPDLLACQVTIDAASHRFLDYDSHVDCTTLQPLPRARVLDDLVASPGRMKGRASLAVLEQVKAAVKRAPTLSLQEQTLVVAALGG